MDVKFESAVVTGVAGFVGSRLAETLLELGVRVRGLDSITPYYSPELKHANLAVLSAHKEFDFRRVDLSTDDLASHLEGGPVVFHQAAQPGVRSSWANGFPNSVTNNVTATQRLLEAAKDAHVERFVYASSSSVYGEAAETPMTEGGPLRPFSPYGVTKLSAEQLCTVYADNWGLPTVSLRYFTVYGPGQRPDMAIHRLMQSALCGVEFPLYASSDHIRDFTYVDDIVAANLAAARPLPSGTIMNVAGGAVVTMRELMSTVEEVTGRRLKVVDEAKKAGDVTRTEADLKRVKKLLAWSPQIGLREGLGRQMEWHEQRADLLALAD